MKIYKKNGLLETKKLAGQLAGQLKGGEIFGLIGPLGAGKTAFVKALGKALGVKKNISSPTFVLLNSYQTSLSKPLKNPVSITLYHLDFYRTKSFKEILTLGIPEVWGKKNSLTLIEWADKFQKHLPKKTKFIEFRD